MICPNCGGNLRYRDSKEEWECDTCPFPVCPNCEAILNDEEDTEFLTETGKCPYCEKEFGGNDD